VGGLGWLGRGKVKESSLGANHGETKHRGERRYSSGDRISTRREREEIRDKIRLRITLQQRARGTGEATMGNLRR